MKVRPPYTHPLEVGIGNRTEELRKKGNKPGQEPLDPIHIAPPPPKKHDLARATVYAAQQRVYAARCNGGTS